MRKVLAGAKTPGRVAEKGSTIKVGFILEVTVQGVLRDAAQKGTYNSIGGER